VLAVGNMQWNRSIDNGVELCIKVIPRASKSGVQGLHGDALKIRLHAPPVDGKANEALIRFLAKTLDVPRARIEIRSGQTSRRKTIRIAGITAEEAEAELL